jgi:uncharacterized protein YciI
MNRSAYSARILSERYESPRFKTYEKNEQAQWDEHAAFMDQLVAVLVELAGPLDEGDGDDALLVINAADKETIFSTFKDNPWIQSGTLEIKTIQRWTIFLEAGQ